MFIAFRQNEFCTDVSRTGWEFRKNLILTICKRTFNNTFKYDAYVSAEYIYVIHLMRPADRTESAAFRVVHTRAGRFRPQ